MQRPDDSTFEVHSLPCGEIHPTMIDALTCRAMPGWDDRRAYAQGPPLARRALPCRVVATATRLVDDLLA
jgi:hypothetical protein